MRRHLAVALRVFRVGSAGFGLLSFALVLLLVPAGCGGSSREDWETLKTRIRTQFPAVAQLQTEELDRWLTEGREVVLLDTRSTEEYEVSHLEGALHAETLKQAVEILEHNPSGRTIVAYCSVGYRSSELAAQLQKLGFEVYNLEGSIFEWANEGRPVFQGGVRVEKVHPYDSTWGRFLDSRFWKEDSTQ